MGNKEQAELSRDTSSYTNAVIGEGALIDPDVMVGYRYHPECGPTRIGKSAILRKGTIIYGDVNIGDHFHSTHYAVIRAMVQIGDFCTLLNHSTLASNGPAMSRTTKSSKLLAELSEHHSPTRPAGTVAA